MEKAIDLVVARYKENLSWLNDVPQNINILVYNKDDSSSRSRMMSFYRESPAPINAPERSKIIKLPNIGREADTYLAHIIENYNNLADTTVFCQGSPFDHSPEILKLLSLSDKYSKVQPLTDRYLDTTKIPPQCVQDSKKENIGGIRVCSYPMSFYNFHPLEFHDPGATIVLESYMKHHDIKNGTNIVEFTLKKCGFVIDYPVPTVGHFCYAAIFAVAKENILKHPLQAYKNLREMNASGNKLSASALERMWLYVFGFEPKTAITEEHRMFTVAESHGLPEEIPEHVQEVPVKPIIAESIVGVSELPVIEELSSVTNQRKIAKKKRVIKEIKDFFDENSPIEY